MHSFTALAIGLVIVAPSSARSTSGPYTDLEHRDTSTNTGNVMSWINRFFRRQAPESCVEDEYFNFAYNSTFGQSFCMAYMTYPNTTVTVTTTPISTFTDVYTTRTNSQTVYEAGTTTETVTVVASPAANVKRDMTGADIQDVFSRFRSERAAIDDDEDTMSASFSSACACQTYFSTVTTTATASARVVTRSAFANANVVTTVIEGQSTTATTVTVSSATSVAGTVSAIPASSSAATVADPTNPTSPGSTPGSTPVAPPFSCPEDNNSTVSQLIGNERFDYLILCDTDITDANFYNVLSYNTFSECAAACSVADRQFDFPVCQGFSYYDTNESQNCFLKSTANNTVSAGNVDSAILQKIAVGISPDDPEGTNTETIPFVASTPVMGPGEMSSSMSEIMGNSSTSIPLITPRPTIPGGYLVDADGNTIYSTYESNGGTFSTGTYFSTYFTSDGMWYETYYSAYSVAWAAETTVYAASETGYVLSNSSDTDTVVQPGANGETITITTTNTTYWYDGGYNVTAVTSIVTTAGNGTEVASTAVTSYYTIETGGAGGIGGGSSGGASGNISAVSAGTITGSFSTSIFSTVTVISGGSGLAGSTGGGASGVIQTSAPALPGSDATSGGTMFSTGGGNSGPITMTSSISSGPIAVPTPFASNGTVSGTVFSTGGANSGMIPSSVSFGSVSIINATGSGLAFSTGFLNSGIITPSSTPTPSSSTGTFSNTGVLRSGTTSTTRRTSTRTTISPSASTPTSPPSNFTMSIATPSASTIIAPSSNFTISTIFPSGATSTSSSSNSTISASTITVPAVTTRTQTIPFGTGLTGYSFPQFSGTGVTFNGVITSTAISGGFYSSTAGNLSGALPTISRTGTGYYPTGTAPTSSRPFFPTGTAPTGTGFFPSFTNSLNSRSGTTSSSSTLSGPSSCVTNFMATTTIFVTETETVRGCYDNCPPAGGYGGGNPLTFGPPGGAKPTRY